MSQIVINELSSLFLTFTFRDETGALVIPTTIEWRVDDVDDPHVPVQVLDWASVGVGSSVNVQIPAASNSIGDQTRNYESRVVTVRMDSALSTMAHQKKHYKIKNLSGAP